MIFCPLFINLFNKREVLKSWICFEDRTYRIANLFYVNYKRKEWSVIPRFLACGTEIWNCRKKSH